MQTVTFKRPFKYYTEGGGYSIYPADRPMEVSEAIAVEAKRLGYVEEPASEPRPVKKR